MSDVLPHRIDGGGEPLLLLNGGMMSIASWDHIVPELAAHHRVIRCDFRGQLLAPGEPPPTLAGHAADVVRLLDHLGCDRVHVIGTSFGAEVGLLLAASYRERVASLIAATATDVATATLRQGGRQLRLACQAAAAGGDPGQVFELMLPFFYSARHRAAHAEELAGRRALMAELPRGWFAAAAALLASTEELDLRPYLPHVACPTLVVAAEDDRVMPLAHARALAGAIPGALLEVVEGSGHVLVVEKPKEFVALCLDFLATVSDKGGPS